MQGGLVLVAVLLYFGVRGLTHGEVGAAVEHGRQVLDFERRLGLDIEHGAQRLVVPHPRLVALANWIYIWGHWPVITATLLWLHRVRRDRYLLLRNAMFISGAIGLVIFASFAVAPPRLAGVGLVDTVTQHSNSYRVLQPPSLVNKYAAIPSLHVGWNLLVGVVLYRSSRRRIVARLRYRQPAPDDRSGRRNRQPLRDRCRAGRNRRPGRGWSSHLVATRGVDDLRQLRRAGVDDPSPTRLGSGEEDRRPLFGGDRDRPFDRLGRPRVGGVETGERLTPQPVQLGLVPSFPGCGDIDQCSVDEPARLRIGAAPERHVARVALARTAPSCGPRPLP